MTKSEFTALIREQSPRYAHESDERILELVKNAALAPGAQKIHSFLKAHQISTGLLSGWFQKKLTIQQAETLEAAVRVARALNEADMSMRSSELGVPRENLGAYVLNGQQYEHERQLAYGTHLAALKIKDVDLAHAKDFESHKADLQKQLIDHDVQKKVELADREAQADLYDAQALMRRMDALALEIEELEKKPSGSARDRMLKERKAAHALMSKEYHAKFGR